MDRGAKIKDGDKYIHCHLCQKHCPFLTKYGVDIDNTTKPEALAYHRLLYGKCLEVCPIGIDGRDIILDMKRA